MTSDISEQLHGIVVPVITPLTEHRDFDRSSAERLYAHLVEIDVQGLFLFGTSGEGPLLGSADRRLALETAVATAGSSVPILAGAIEPGTKGVIQQALAARELGADAVVVCAPFYFPASQTDVLRHFRAVREAVDLPIVAYDIPQTTHTKIQLTTLMTLAREGTIVAVKDSSPDFVGFRRLLEQRPPGFRVFTGAEMLLDAALQFGADGTVPGLANVAPELFVQLYKFERAGDFEQVAEVQSRLLKLFEVFLTADGNLETATAIGAMKSAMQLRGLIETNTLAAPFSHVTDKQHLRTQRIMKEVGVL
jgi:4-hydroxy-tetrahydrodipicolinate synthase